MYKPVLPQGGAVAQRGPSPLSNPPISPGQSMGSICQTRMPGNTAANMYTGMYSYKRYLYACSKNEPFRQSKTLLCFKVRVIGVEVWFSITRIFE